MDQELSSLPENMNLLPVLVGFEFIFVLYLQIYVYVLWIVVLSVLRFTHSVTPLISSSSSYRHDINGIVLTVGKDTYSFFFIQKIYIFSMLLNSEINKR